MKLTALETEYCNANWTFNLKLKSLREELEQKARKQNELQVQLAALKNCYADHQNEVKSVLAQMAKANVPGQC
jgi:predicted  nucleic acid-binding Zn-ribbon protein